MSSVEDTEVFIPEQACVITVPVQSLPSSITKKMSACPLQSNQLATFISPVELREKGMTQKSRTLTPGQFFLPVVTSNREAFRMLRNFLHSGENSLQFSEEKSRVGSEFSRKKNSIILFNTEIFLIVRKDKMADLSLEQQNPAPSKCEAPPLNSPVKMQDGGSDVTEGQSKEGGECGAEDHGEYAEMQSAADVVQCEAQDDDITARKRCEDGPGPAEDNGKCAKEVLKEREADAINDREENELLMKDMSTNTPSAIDKSRYIKTEEESDVSASVTEAQSLLTEADEFEGGERLITASLTENSNEELACEHGCANELRLSKETHTGNEKSLSDNLKHGDDLANDQAETVLHKQDSDVICAESEANTKISEGESSVVKAKCCKRLIFSGPMLMNSDRRQDKSDVELEIPSDKMETSVSAAEIKEVNANQVLHKNEDEPNCKSYVRIQTSEDQSSRCETSAEIVDANDDDIISYVENAVKTNTNKVEILLEKVERLKRRINDCVKSQGSPVNLQKHISGETIAETADDDDDLIIVESCPEVERVVVRSDVEVVEVMEVASSTTDEPNRHISDDKHHVNKTGEEPICKVSSTTAEAKGCERAVEIIDLDNDRLSHKRETDANRLAAGCSSCSDANSRMYRRGSPSVKHCESAVEIVDLDDDDDDVILNGQEITNICTRQIGDVVKGRKRKIFDGITDETGSDLIGEGEGSSAKRSKDDDVNFSSEGKRLERDEDPKSQVKNGEQDVKIIKVVDDDDDGDDDNGDDDDDDDDGDDDNGGGDDDDDDDKDIDGGDDGDNGGGDDDDDDDDDKDIDGGDDGDGGGGDDDDGGGDVVGDVVADDDENHRSINDSNGNAGDVERCADETKVQRNRGNAEDPSDEVISAEHDVPGGKGDDIKSQSSLEKFKSRKRHLSDSHSTDEPNVDVETHAQAQIKETGDLSVKHFKSVHIPNPGGQTHENCTKTQSLLEVDDQNDYVNKAESLLMNSDVKMVPVHDNNQILSKSKQELNQDHTNTKNEVNTTINQISAAQVLMSEVQSCKGAAEIMDIHDDDPDNDTDRILPNVERCPNSHVNEVQNESPAETEEVRDKVSSSENAADGQNCDVTIDGVYFKYGDNLKHSDDPANDQVITGQNILHKQDSDVTCAERDAKTKISEGECSVAEAEFQRQDKSDFKVQISESEIPSDQMKTSVSAAEIVDVNDNRVSYKNTADANEDEATCTKSYVTIQTGEVQHCESSVEIVDINGDDPVSDIISDDDDDADEQNCDIKNDRFKTRPQVEEVGVSLSPSSPPAEQEFDYMVLRREENISRIRARLRGMEEKLSTLINLHR